LEGQLVGSPIYRLSQLLVYGCLTRRLPPVGPALAIRSGVPASSSFVWVFTLLGNAGWEPQLSNDSSQRIRPATEDCRSFFQYLSSFRTISSKCPAYRPVHEDGSPEPAWKSRTGSV